MGSKYFWTEECPRCGKEAEGYDQPTALMWSVHCDNCGWDDDQDYYETDEHTIEKMTSAEYKAWEKKTGLRAINAMNEQEFDRWHKTKDQRIDLVATDNQSQDEQLKSATPSDNIDKAVEEILTYLVVPRGQVIPYDEGDQKSAEMAGALLDHWAKTEAKPIIKEATQALLEIINNEKIAELERLPRVTYTQDGKVSDISILLQHQHLKDRIKELKSTSKEDK